jgi:hypothetical protein
LVVASFFVNGPRGASEQSFGGLASVNFAPDVAYPDAIRTITDLGLYLAEPCIESGADWRYYVYAAFAYGMLIVVAPSDSAAPYWLFRLQHAQGVLHVDDLSGAVVSCPALLTTPGALHYLAPSHTGIYLRVTFSDTAHESALVAVSDIGLRLADACAERQFVRIWQPAGQESGFATSHTLTLATSLMASTAWQDQVQLIPGISAIQVLRSGQC